MQRNRFVSDCGGVCKLRDWTGMAHQHHADVATKDRDVDESRRLMVGGEADGLGDAPGHHLRRRMPSVVRIDNLPPQVKHDI